MEKLKSVDYKILAALMKNAKISDRQLAKEIGVSQPTVTRRRAKLETETLDGYTAVPNWAVMGFEILAITVFKSHPSAGVKENVHVNVEKAAKWLMKQPSVLLASGCRGMGRNAVLVSVHKSYADFDRFMSEHKRELGYLFSEADTALVNLGGGEVIKPLHLKYLAEAL